MIDEVRITVTVYIAGRDCCTPEPSRPSLKIAGRAFHTLWQILFETERPDRINFMGKLFNRIREAVADDRFVVSWHADERCEEREVTAWQLVAGLQDAELMRERPRSKPLPSVVVRTELADGSKVEVIWAWMSESRRAKLVTVFFRD